MKERFGDNYFWLRRKKKRIAIVLSIACGKRRKRLLLYILDKGIVTKAKNSANANAKILISDTSRSYSYKLLNDFVKKRLLEKIESKGIYIYQPTEKAIKIAGYIKN